MDVMSPSGPIKDLPLRITKDPSQHRFGKFEQATKPYTMVFEWVLSEGKFWASIPACVSCGSFHLVRF